MPKLLDQPDPPPPSARPIPDYVGAPPPLEDFALWCEHPVTRLVATVMAMKIEQMRREWIRMSWDMGMADKGHLDAFRARADTFAAMIQCDWSDYVTTYETLADLRPRVARSEA